MQPTTLPLRDIHIPEPISWWPPAIGWWVLAVLIPLSLYLLYRLYKRLTRKTALKAAKKQFKQLQENQELSPQDKLIQLASLLRRIAVSLYPRAEVASLTGEQWMNFLDASLQHPEFKQGIGLLLVDAPYRRSPNLAELDALFSLCETWINLQKEPKT